jgi:putative sterol carrier protein
MVMPGFTLVEGELPGCGRFRCVGYETGIIALLSVLGLRPQQIKRGEPVMAFKFPSDEWIQEFSRQLNASPEYERSGQVWEGDFLFIIEADEAYPENVYMYLDLFHGKCRRAAQLSSLDEVQTGYILSATYSNWRKVIEAKLDPIQGLMTRKLKLKGDMLQVMRYPKAAKDMVNCVLRVPSDFTSATLLSGGPQKAQA